MSILSTYIWNILKMLSRNILLSVSAVRTLRPRLSCHCRGVGISKGFEGWLAVVFSQMTPLLGLEAILMFGLICLARFVSVHHGE